MDVAVNLYENIEPRRDILFFKVGAHGLISFHGRNYNIKKRLSAEQRALLTEDPSFFRVASDCYVNVDKITEIASDYLIFGDRSSTAKRLPVSKRKQQLIKQRMLERSQSPILV